MGEMDMKESQIYNRKKRHWIYNKVDTINRADVTTWKEDLAKAGGEWTFQVKGFEAGTSWHIPRSEKWF